MTIQLSEKSTTEVTLPAGWTVGVVRVGYSELYGRWFQDADGSIENDEGTHHYHGGYEIDSYTELAVVNKSFMEKLNGALCANDPSALSRAAYDVTFEADENRWSLL